MEMYQFPPDETMNNKTEENKRKHEYLAAINRKRPMPVDDTHSLHAKISKEAAKLIKMKVANDAVNWELKEQVKDLESVRERQQQNLLEIQMQYEKLDGDFQNELRLREDIMSKVVNTRSICGILEQHFAAVKRSLTACQADRQTLCDSYHRAVEVINSIKVRVDNNEEQYNIKTQKLQEQLLVEKQMKDLSENSWLESKKNMSDMIEQLKNQINDQAQMISYLKQQREEANCLLTKSKHDLECISNDAKQLQHQNSEQAQMLSFLKQQKDEANCSVANIKQDHERISNDLKQREDAIGSLQAELAALNKNFLEHKAEKDEILSDYEKKLFKAEKEVELQKHALSNQDSFVAVVMQEKTQLMDKLCQLEDTVQQQSEVINDHKQNFMQLSNKLELMKTEKINMQNNEDMLNTRFLKQKKDFEETCEVLKVMHHEKQALEVELGRFVSEQESWEGDKRAAYEAHERVKVSLQEEVAARKIIEMEKADVKKQLGDLQEELNKYKSETDEKISNLMKEVKISNADLDAKSDIIASLMSQLKSSTDVRAKLEISLEQLNKDANSVKISHQDQKTALEDNIQILQREINIMKNFNKKTSDDNSSLKKRLKTLEKSHASVLSSAKKSKENLAKAIDNVQKTNASENHNKEPMFSDDESNDALINGNNGNGLSWTIPARPKPISKIRVATLDKKKHSQDFLSDSSFEGYVFDPAHIERHFNDIATGSKSPIKFAAKRIVKKYDYPATQSSFLGTQDKSGVVSKNEKPPSKKIRSRANPTSNNTDKK